MLLLILLALVVPGLAELIHLDDTKELVFRDASLILDRSQEPKMICYGQGCDLHMANVIICINQGSGARPSWNCRMPPIPPFVLAGYYIGCQGNLSDEDLLVERGSCNIHYALRDDSPTPTQQGSSRWLVISILIIYILTVLIGVIPTIKFT